MFPIIIIEEISFTRKTEYLEKTIYHAFYAFESLYTRTADHLLCAICGITPDILFGGYLSRVVYKINSLSTTAFESSIFRRWN
jgi:hypothetical protein